MTVISLTKKVCRLKCQQKKNATLMTEPTIEMGNKVTTYGRSTAFSKSTRYKSIAVVRSR